VGKVTGTDASDEVRGLPKVGVGIVNGRQAPALAPGVSQQGNLDACRIVWGAGSDFQLKGAEDVHEGSPIGRGLDYRAQSIP